MGVPKQELVEKLEDDFYRWPFDKIDISVIFREDSTTDFETFEDWLEAHFLLSKPVGEFLDQLPAFLRELNTTTNSPYVQTKGELRGPIDWKRTIEYRARTNYQDRTRFVCRERTRSFETDKNLVLKRLLKILREIGDKELDLTADETTVWHDGENYGSKEELRLWRLADEDGDNVQSPEYQETVVETLENNVYLDKIEIDENTLTDRTVDEVMKAREAMYREAAELLKKYRRIRNIQQNEDQELVKELLKSGAFLPGDVNTMFELFWIFELLPDPDQHDDLQYSYPSDEKGMIGKWENENHKYELYHNRGSPDNWGEQLRFKKPELDEDSLSKGRSIPEEERIGIKDIYLNNLSNKQGRQGAETYLKFAYATERTMKQTDALGVGMKSEGTKRPDIVLMKKDADENLKELFIGEIKNSSSRDKIRSGARELIEYVLMACYQNNSGDGSEKTPNIPNIPYEEPKLELEEPEESVPIRVGLFFQSKPDSTSDCDIPSELNFDYQVYGYETRDEYRDESVFGEKVFEGT